VDEKPMLDYREPQEPLLNRRVAMDLLWFTGAVILLPIMVFLTTAVLLWVLWVFMRVV